MNKNNAMISVQKIKIIDGFLVRNLERKPPEHSGIRLLRWVDLGTYQVQRVQLIKHIKNITW